MNEPPSAAPNKRPAAPVSAKEAQKQRLAEALRENLRRRKAQARGRKAEADGEAGS